MTERRVEAVENNENRAPNATVSIELDVVARRFRSIFRDALKVAQRMGGSVRVASNNALLSPFFFPI